jgi:hypothetical protein
MLIVDRFPLPLRPITPPHLTELSEFIRVKKQRSVSGVIANGADRSFFFMSNKLNFSVSKMKIVLLT